MADVKPLKLVPIGGGQAEMRECVDGDGEYWVVAPYCTALGTANTLMLTLQHGLGKPSAYRAGQQFRFRASLSNTGAATINVAGLGAKTAVTVTGAALPAGYIRTDVDTTITYDAVSDRFVVGRDIERGSNANGEYVRFADGTQMCRFITATSATEDSTWTYPAAFSSGVRVFISAGTSTNNSVVQSRPSPTLNSCNFAGFVGNTAARQLIGVNIQAIGFWY